MDKQAMAAALGIDPSKIDWAKVLQFVRLLLDFFQHAPVGHGPGDVACQCREAARLALESAKVSLDCACCCEVK